MSIYLTFLKTQFLWLIDFYFTVLMVRSIYLARHTANLCLDVQTEYGNFTNFRSCSCAIIIIVILIPVQS